MRSKKKPPVPPPNKKEGKRVESLFAKIGSEFGAVEENRIRALYKKYEAAKPLKASEKNELVHFEIIRQGLAANGERLSATGCAERIIKIHKYPCNKDDIFKWRTGKRRPPVGEEKFPLGDAAGKNTDAQVDEWARKSLPTGGVNGVVADQRDSRQRIEDANARKAEREADEYEKATDGNWGRIASMKSFAIGLAAIIGGANDKLIEDRDGVRKFVREAAARCGASEEFILRQDAELETDLRNANDKSKAQARIEGERAMKRFEQQRKEELKQNK